MKSLLCQVEHSDWSAELQIPSGFNLDFLAHAINESIGFDFDHAFGFHDNLRNPYRSKEDCTLFADLGEEAKEGDTGVEKALVEAVFRPKKRMLFLFDSGDAWMFPVTCTGEAETKPFKRPKLLASTGTPPEQYPNWEEGDDD